MDPRRQTAFLVALVAGVLPMLFCGCRTQAEAPAPIETAEEPPRPAPHLPEIPWRTEYPLPDGTSMYDARLSPDGKCLFRDRMSTGIEVVRIADGEVLLRAEDEWPDTEFSFLGWSPDGRRFALYSVSPRILVVLDDAYRPSAEYCFPEDIGLPRAWDTEGWGFLFTRWEPDDERYLGDRVFGECVVYRWDLERGRRQKLFASRPTLGRPIWSPDRRWLALEHGWSSDSKGGATRILDATTGETVFPKGDLEALARECRWPNAGSPMTWVNLTTWGDESGAIYGMLSGPEHAKDGRVYRVEMPSGEKTVLCDLREVLTEEQLQGFDWDMWVRPGHNQLLAPISRLYEDCSDDTSILIDMNSGEVTYGVLGRVARQPWSADGSRLLTSRGLLVIGEEADQ